MYCRRNTNLRLSLLFSSPIHVFSPYKLVFEPKIINILKSFQLNYMLQRIHRYCFCSGQPLFRTAKFLAYVAQTGYIPFNSPIEMGKVNELLKINNIAHPSQPLLTYVFSKKIT